MASCDYWAPARSATEGEDDSECGDDRQTRWGLPDSSPNHKIKTVIALVPDPVRTNMSLQFDRTIDALMAAAGDNGYVSSYYWIPWKPHALEGKSSSEGGEPSTGEASRTEHEPGLIIFKHVPSPSGETSITDAGDEFAKVIYLFLTGESPTTGIDGSQIQKAFQYEDELATPGSPVAVIGPTYSGSAASLRQAIETMLARHRTTEGTAQSVSVNGSTSTRLAVYQLNSAGTSQHCVGQPITYQSFAYDGKYVEQRLLALLSSSTASAQPRVAFLVEEGTAFGNAALNSASNKKPDSPKPFSSCPASSDPDPQPDALRTPALTIRFPRDISLLRNAHAEQIGAEGKDPQGAAPSPFLRFSLKDSNAHDSVPHLSADNTPISQEAQLMAIARQLQRYGSQYIVISATSILDQLFLAQFLHRACPDARLMFSTGDLLFEREVDNVPFIGSTTFTPYPLMGAGPSVTDGPRRVFSDSGIQAYYNAASYSIYHALGPEDPIGSPLAGYRMNLLSNSSRPPVWVTAIGSDGYYPLGIAGQTATGISQILPSIPPKISPSASPAPRSIQDRYFRWLRSGFPIAPGRLWCFLCVLVALLCISQCMLLLGADYWSPLTRELAVEQNNQPRRRATYIHIASSMLFCMAFVLAFPPFPTFRFFQPDPAAIFCSMSALLAGTAAVVITFWKTRLYIGWKTITEGKPPGKILRVHHSFQHNAYFSLNMIAWITLLAVPVLWTYLCCTDQGILLSPKTSFVGLFFSFRCVHPGSGVSPIVPVLLLLFSWYLWAVFQTLRLRFSECSRPVLPSTLELGTPYPFYVSDDVLSESEGTRNPCRYRNITCLLITREVWRRFISDVLKKRSSGLSGPKERDRFEAQSYAALDGGLVAVYFIGFVLFAIFVPVRSLDVFFWNLKGFPTPYEFLVTALFFPLLVVALTGWLRMILVWGALKRGLLERLENLPIRFAFDRLKAVGWMTMLRQGGMSEQMRDMARSTESIRQMVNDPILGKFIRDETSKRTFATVASSPGDAPPDNLLQSIHKDLTHNIEALRAHMSGAPPPADLPIDAVDQCHQQNDVPGLGHRNNVILTHAIENNFAKFSEVLLEYVLVPSWKKRSGLVLSREDEGAPGKAPPRDVSEEADQGSGRGEPGYIRAAEEFVAIRYLSLIRAVLINLRYLMVFVSLSFVLAIVAWNSYPFQPRQLIDWVFTGMLAVLGAGIILVFAQMHRDPLLSRITHTEADALGAEFYIRIVTFGAVPIITWLAYQFPDVGSTIFKFLQPALEVSK